MKIIHIADVHLGAEPDLGFAWSKERKEDIWNSFREVIRICRQEKTDVLLIAGDLFHRSPLQRELKEVHGLFESIPDTRVVMMAGNHDYLKTGGFYEKFVWGDNVIFLTNSSCEWVEIPEFNLSVYGCSYHAKEITEPLYDTVRPAGSSRYHILLAHGGDAKHSPFNKDTLLDAGFDYVALGHIHKPQVLVENRIAYAGALEPIDCNDMGDHGYMEVELDDRGTRANFVSFATGTYKIVEVEIHENTTQFTLEENVRARLSELGEKEMVHLHLLGSRSPETEFQESRLSRLGRIVRVRDLTRPCYDLDLLERRYAGSLVGEFVKRLKDTEGVEKKALYYGLEALLDTKR